MPDFGMRGEFRLLIKSAADGKIRRDLHFSNLILNCGMDGIGYNYSMFGACTVGSNNSAPSVTQSAVLNPVATSIRTGGAGSPNSAQAATEANGWVFSRHIVYRFLPGEITRPISEIGVHSNGAIDGEIRYFCRTLIKDENDNPVTITVLDNEYLDVIHSIYCHPDVSDQTFTFTLNGVTYTGTARPSSITGTYNFVVGNNSLPSGGLRPIPRIQYLYYNDEAQLGAITGAPTTQSTTMPNVVNNTDIPYIAGSNCADTIINMGVDFGIQPFKALTVVNKNTGNSGSCCFSSIATQMVFDKPIPKDGNTAINLTFRRSWGRL